MTKKIVIILIFGIIGFIVGYAFFADIAGFRIGLKTLIIGTQTGLDFADNITAEVLNTARQRVLISTVIGLLLGIISVFTFLKKITN